MLLQGLFKNTVVCSECQYPSVTFEPFMYLAVPLPSAVVLQIEVTFVSAAAAVCGQPAATSYLLDMTQADNIASLKVELCRIIDEDENGGDFAAPSVDQLTAVELCGHRVMHNLEDWTLLRNIRDGKQVCVIQRMSTAEADKESSDPDLVPPLIPTELPLPMIGPMPMPMPSPTGDGNTQSNAAFGDVLSGDAVSSLLTETVSPMLPVQADDVQSVTVTASGDGQQTQSEEQQEDGRGDGGGMVTAAEVVSSQAMMAVDESKDEVTPPQSDLAAAGSVAQTNGTVSPFADPSPPVDLSCVICMEELPASEVFSYTVNSNREYLVKLSWGFCSYGSTTLVSASCVLPVSKGRSSTTSRRLKRKVESRRATYGVRVAGKRPTHPLSL